MRQSILHISIAVALALLLIAIPGEARRLMEIDAIELRGTARVLASAEATCHVLKVDHTACGQDKTRHHGEVGCG